MVTSTRKVPLRRVWVCGIPAPEPFQVRVTALRPGKSLPTTEIVAPGAALLGVTVSCVAAPASGTGPSSPTTRARKTTERRAE